MWPYSNSFQSTEGAGHDAAEAQLEVASHLAEAQLSRASNLLLIPIRNSGTGLLALKSGCSVLENLSLPLVKHCRVDLVPVAQIRNGFAFDQICSRRIATWGCTPKPSKIPSGSLP